MKILDQHKFNIYFSPFSFEKQSEDDVLDYDFKLSFDHILNTFSDHYNYLMETERECYDFEDDYEDFYKNLHKLNFPNLNEVINIDKESCFLFLQEYLRPQFLDETLNGYPKDKKRYGFAVNSLHKMTLLDQGIRIEGSGFLVLPSVFKRLTYEESLKIIEELC